MAANLSAERWAQVNGILRRAVELSPPVRREFVHQACGERPSLCREVIELLDAYEADEKLWNFDSTPMVGYALQALAAKQNASFLNDKVGPYRILHELGAGGMGTVYLAARDDLGFEQQVAIKIGHQYAANADFLQRRVQAERAILARLEHPNIARLLDSGTTANGLPFFVMEYVVGIPITTYSWQHRLTTRQRLEMFQSVCRAVHYAHQNLVIHRDLKPGNILVTEAGVPKLIDFGIAKLLNEQNLTEEPHTVTRQRAMTVPYASPEQVRGEPVTTATDVYALGVVLYELLTGSLPFQMDGVREDRSSLEYLIQQVDPPRPSVAVRQMACMLKLLGTSVEPQPTPSRELAGDLDAIVMRAIHKDPQARYASAEQLVADIERYLQGWPVLARGASARYRLRKFLDRHRLTVSFTLGFIAVLVALTIVSLRQSHLAAQAEEQARRQFQETWSLARSNIFELHDAIKPLPGSTAARGTLVRQTLGYLDRLAAQASPDPRFQRELGLAYIRVGEVQGRPYTANLGDVPGALKSYMTGQRWLEEASRLQPNDFECIRDLSISYERLGEVYMYRLHDFTTSRRYLERAAALRQRLSVMRPEDPEVRYLQATLAIAYGDWSHMQSRIQAALEDFAAAHRLLKPLATSPSAAPSYRRLLAGVLQREVYCLLNLGLELENAELPTEAQSIYRRALACHQQVLSIRKNLLASQLTSVELRRSVLDSLVDEAEINGRLKRFEVSQRQFQAVFEQFQSLLAEDSANQELLLDMLSLLSRFAGMEEAAGDPTAAMAQWQRIQMYWRTLSETGFAGTEIKYFHVEILLRVVGLASRSGQVAVGQQAAQRLEALLPNLPDPAQRVRGWRVLAEAYMRLGNPNAAQAAKDMLAQWLAQSEAEVPTGAVIAIMADLYLDRSLGLHNPQKALKLLRLLAASEGENNFSLHLVKALHQAGHGDEARYYCKSHLEGLQALLQALP
ncbi:MAG: serine/threonine protein kinase [Acidobacteriota bacterium]